MKKHYFNLHKEKDRELFYPIISNWWKKWKQTPIPPKALPETGLMISNKGIFICCGFLYKTDSIMSIIGWIISNPNKEHRELRTGAIELLIESLENLAKQMGFEAFFVPARNPNLIKKLNSLGYDLEKADRNMNNFIKI